VINPVQAVDLAPVPAGMPPPPAASQDRVRAQAVAAAPDRIVMSVPEEGIETPATLPGEALPLAPEAPEPDPEAPPAITVLPDRADESTPSIGDRVVPLTEREAAIPLTDRDVAAPPAQVSPLPAWMRFASRAETPPGAVLSVVLLDPGVSAQARDAFIALGLPVTVALDTSELDPAPALSAYRASGVEVLLIPGPAGAEATLAAYPEALGLLEGDDGPPRAGALAVDGHGLVLQPDGLNGAVQDMAREGLPALRIFRQIDAQQERPEVIVRYLSRAAFEAAQTGGVVMLGTILPDTLEALEMFRDSPDDRGVILAPVSVQMRRLMSMPGERG
jgi:hypothetical protein